MTVVLAMIGIYNGLVADALAVVKAPAADVWVVEAAPRAPSPKPRSIPPTTRDAVARMPGVAEAGAINYQNVEASLMPARRLRLYVIGYEPGRPGGPQRIAEGRGIGTAISNWWQTARPAFAGETIRLGRNRFTVVGSGRRGDELGRRSGGLCDAGRRDGAADELDPAAQRVQAARGAVSVKSARRSPP
jgi:putative ABC transport system permease protein